MEKKKKKIEMRKGKERETRRGGSEVPNEREREKMSGCNLLIFFYMFF